MRAQFVLSEIGVGLRRNLTMTFAVIVSVALSLGLFGASLLMRDQVSTMKGYWYDKVNVSIFFCNKNDAESGANCAKGAATQQQKNDIKAELDRLPIVQKVTYESSDQAYKHYKEQFGDTPVAGLVTPDQLPESYRVKLKDPTKFTVIKSAFSERPGVMEVQDQRDTVEPLFNLLNGMNIAALVVMGLMLVVALMLIVNTVRVSAFSRRRETGIMRLVGASSFYIQMPFILEAAIAGLLGAAFACVLIVGGKYILVNNWLAERIQVINFIGWD
ncbi:permease-like cell division protein FtsX, partial [Streptomyces nigrescens]